MTLTHPYLTIHCTTCKAIQHYKLHFESFIWKWQAFLYSKRIARRKDTVSVTYIKFATLTNAPGGFEASRPHAKAHTAGLFGTTQLVTRVTYKLTVDAILGLGRGTRGWTDPAVADGRQAGTEDGCGMGYFLAYQQKKVKRNWWLLYFGTTIHKQLFLCVRQRSYNREDT